MRSPSLPRTSDPPFVLASSSYLPVPDLCAREVTVKSSRTLASQRLVAPRRPLCLSLAHFKFFIHTRVLSVSKLSRSLASSARSPVRKSYQVLRKLPLECSAFYADIQDPAQSSFKDSIVSVGDLHYFDFVSSEDGACSQTYSSCLGSARSWLKVYETCSSHF